MDFHIEHAVEYLFCARIETTLAGVSQEFLEDLHELGVDLTVSSHGHTSRIVLAFNCKDIVKFGRALNLCWDYGHNEIKVVREWF